MTKTFTSRAELWRRAFKDTFSFWSDDTANWAVGSWQSDVRPNGTNVNQQIVPDGRGTGGFPNRQFYETLDGKGASNLPPVVVTETVVCRTDATRVRKPFRSEELDSSIRNGAVRRDPWTSCELHLLPGQSVE